MSDLIVPALAAAICITTAIFAWRKKVLWLPAATFSLKENPVPYWIGLSFYLLGSAVSLMALFEAIR